MKSIAFKLWLGMMLLVAVVLLLLWFFQIVFLENFYTAQRVNDVKNKGFAIVNDIENLDKEELDVKLEIFIYDYNSTIELVDLNGNITYSNGPGMQMPMMAHNLLKGDLFKELISGKIITQPMTHPRFNSDYMIIGIPFMIDNTISGALLINMPLAPVEDTAAILKNQLVYISVILFSVALLLSFIISRSFTKPLLKITKATTEMASGNLSVRLKIESEDEIGRLSNSINHLGEELSKIEQLRRDFIANVSHELRTPLSLIRGYAETIRDVSGHNEEKRENQLEIIIEESNTLSTIVDDMLSLSRMQSGNLVLDTSLFDLNKTITSVINKYGIICDQLGIKIIYKNSDTLMVNGDEAKIEQVLRNLINNALNYSTLRNSITITATKTDSKVKVKVSDTGEGISAEDLKHIWERYYKADKSTNQGRMGTGLGLAIVKTILEAHNSKFGVESIKGSGTTFWFEI